MGWTQKSRFWPALLRWGFLVALAMLALQLFFLLRIVCMHVLDPQSTAFERSQAWQLLTHPEKPWEWQQHWVPYEKLSDHLKRAVIASEDSDFIYHGGVEWEAVEKAWQHNNKAQTRSSAQNTVDRRKGKSKAPKIIGGSTITQQLGKNLFLSGERNWLRKSQELVLTMTLELFLSKQRILEIYLNSVEWGEGVFGAQAAAQHYFGKSVDQLSSYEAARLAVMLPRPKYFEKQPNTAYLNQRAQTILARMGDAELP
ncbi:MAG: monofunctional biosynthetic peptidoglycan transglycosylase [Burkholderiaceae bacterium]